VTLYVAPASGSLVPVWSASTVTCTIALPSLAPIGELASSCADSVHSVTVAAGDTAYYQVSLVNVNQAVYVTASLGSS
jgi:hypothetical protein